MTARIILESLELAKDDVENELEDIVVEFGFFASVTHPIGKQNSLFLQVLDGVLITPCRPSLVVLRVGSSSSPSACLYPQVGREDPHAEQMFVLHPLWRQCVG